MQLNRGHEKMEHRAMKQLIAKLFTLLDFLVFFEERECDVVAWKCQANGHVRLVGIEAERSTRNLIRNVTRDLARGCCIVLIVVPVDALRTAARRQVQQYLPDFGTKVGITTASAIEQVIARLEERREK